MKISNSKKELARIISENGGWRDGSEFAAQDSNKNTYGARVCFYRSKPYVNGSEWTDGSSGLACNAGECIDGLMAINNWHQTILSREEYFFLHQDQGLEDALDEPMVEAKPTIEQLAADYRNASDYADRKQKEADDAKADADAKLKALELTCEAIGLIVSPITAKQGPELVITDWRDLQAGDVISVSGKWWGPDSEYTVDENDGSRDAPIRVGGYWALIGECSFKFIRRP